MEQLFNILLITHATAGGVALFSGSINMLRKKGDIIHTKIGLVYFYAVILNAICAFFLAMYHPNLFLFSLGVLSFYFVLIGRRNLLKSKPTSDKAVQPIDWLLNIGLFCFGLLLTVYSIYQGFSGEFNIIPFLFGIFPLYISIRVIKKFRSSKQTSNSDFLKAHIGNMVGSYITIFSAFLVVNNRGYFPVLIGWFGPALILVPLMINWIRKSSSKEIT